MICTLQFHRVKTISLGQGQGPRAEKMILDAQRNGHWMVLENCHLAVNWLPELERICNDVSLNDTKHINYRLWCSTLSCPKFPVSVLQNSVKLSIEHSKSLKSRMMRSYSSDPLVRDRFLTYAFSFSEKMNRMWLRGVFSLVWFHAMLQERSEYGPCGWNQPYHFSDIDLK